MTDKVSVNVAIRFYDDGNLSLTFGPVRPEEVGDLLASIGTIEFAEQLVAKLSTDKEDTP